MHLMSICFKTVTVEHPLCHITKMRKISVIHLQQYCKLSSREFSLFGSSQGKIRLYVATISSLVRNAARTNSSCALRNGRSLSLNRAHVCIYCAYSWGQTIVYKWYVFSVLKASMSLLSGIDMQLCNLNVSSILMISSFVCYPHYELNSI